MEDDDYEIPNEINSPKSISNDSIDSLPEINKRIQLFFKICFLVLSLISCILGIFILINKEFYLIKSFKKYYYLILFVIIYSTGTISAFLLSLLISIIMYLISFFFNIFNDKKEIIKNKEIINELDLIYQQEKNSIISYTFSIYTVIIIIEYLLNIPYGIFLILELIQDEKYKVYKSYFFLYGFICLNILIGISLLIIFFFSIICIKSNYSIRQNKNIIDNLDLVGVTKEVEMAFYQYKEIK